MHFVSYYMTSLNDISYLNLKSCKISGTSLGLLLRALMNLRVKKLILDVNDLSGNDSLDYLLSFINGLCKGKCESISLKRCGIDFQNLKRIEDLGKAHGVKIFS